MTYPQDFDGIRQCHLLAVVDVLRGFLCPLPLLCCKLLLGQRRKLLLSTSEDGRCVVELPVRCLPLHVTVSLDASPATKGSIPVVVSFHYMVDNAQRVAE